MVYYVMARALLPGVHNVLGAGVQTEGKDQFFDKSSISLKHKTNAFTITYFHHVRTLPDFFQCL